MSNKCWAQLHKCKNLLLIGIHEEFWGFGLLV